MKMVKQDFISVSNRKLSIAYVTDYKDFFSENVNVIGHNAKEANQNFNDILIAKICSTLPELGKIGHEMKHILNIFKPCLSIQASTTADNKIAIVYSVDVLAFGRAYKNKQAKKPLYKFIRQHTFDFFDMLLNTYYENRI